MKRMYLTAIVAVVVFVTSMLLNPGFSEVIKRWGKQEFYVYVTGKRSWSGSPPRQHFEYQLEGMDEDGVQKTLQFVAPEQLALDTYLRLYVTSAGTVTAWEEIPQQELPERIKNGTIP